ncbi:uncharacterized protein LOC108908510 [Anoplophora glabripennis]|nr:uncharacterized protein LOC108908510 [Anoplophora glabripennis]
MNETKAFEKTQENIQHKGQQSIPNGIKINKDLSENDLNVDKIKSTLKECEDIAREINMGFEAINLDGAVNQESDYKSRCTENLFQKNQPDQLFCGTAEKQSEPKVIPNDVELITPVNMKLKTNLNITRNGDQNNSGQDSADQKYAEKSDSTNGLLHTGELHDSVIIPLFEDSDSKSEDLPKNMDVEQLTKDVSDIQPSKLLHTGELHDTLVVPFSLRAQNLETDNGKQLKDITLTTPEVPLVPPSTSSSNPDVKVPQLKDDDKLNTKGLMHTGEFHDGLVTPLTMDVHQAVTESYSNPPKTSEGALVESTDKHPAPEFSSKQDQPTKLLHTGELHDPIVLPLPKKSPEGTAEDLENSKKADVGEPENNPRQVDSECQTSGDPAIEVQLHEVPAGDEALTSPRPAPVIPDVSDVASRPAQTPDKDALPNASSSDLSSPTDLQGMESEKRNNATVNNKSMEVEAATKIQAGFRGYQVRKQLKLKNGSSDINNQRRQLRRKSSGRLTETNRTPQNKSKEPSDIEEKSAVKIQAGVRGFLVRRRQKKQKNQES